MTVEEIIEQVRWCIDEEPRVDRDYEDTYMDNIIKSKIGAALRWCAMYADAVLLNGDNSADSGAGGMTHDYTVGTTQSDTEPYLQNGFIILPIDTIRVTRVKVSNWHKGVSSFISEDSDEYLMQSDDTSKATHDRPVCAIIETTPIKMQPFPTPSPGATVEISLISSPNDDDVIKEKTEGGKTIKYVSVPPKLSSALCYYIAYLLMCAYSDTTKANAMLSIAKQQISVTVDNK